MSHKFTTIVISLLILLAANAGLFAKKAKADRSLEKISVESEESYQTDNMRVSKVTGLPLALYAIDYTVENGALSAEGIARDYLRNHAGLLGIQADLSDLRHTVTRETPASRNVRFQQYLQGFPVYGADMVINIRENTVNFMMNSYKAGAALSSAKATVATETAKARAISYLGIRGRINHQASETVVYHNQGTTRLAHAIRIVPAEDNFGDWEVLVDAHSGEIFRVEDKACYSDSHKGSRVDGTGRVFDPDPLTHSGASYGGQFGDNNDADTDSLLAHIVTRTLPDITFDGSMYHLEGPYANIDDFESPFFGEFSQATDFWDFTRNPSGFEAALVYFHIDQSMRYINETLGFSLTPFQYSGGVRSDPHGLSGADNSHYIPSTGQVSWGEGGVDDSEDADVVLHELGHGLHDWLTNGSLSQVNGLSEGSGDYWANSYNRGTGLWSPSDPQYAWVFQWDGHNEFWNGRITDYTATYPGGLTGSIHTDGQIWASTLMQIFEDIGRQSTDLNFLEALAMTNSSTNQADAAQAFVQADVNNFGGANLSVIETHMNARGYAVTIPAPSIGHTPLPDTEDVNGPYVVEATIGSGSPLSVVELNYGNDGNFTSTVTMTNTGGSNYSASIPGSGSPANYNYYVYAEDNTGLASTSPPNAPTNFYSFSTGPDNSAPDIQHNPLGDQALAGWPATVSATITDNLSVASAAVEYSVNSGAITGSFALTNTGGNSWSGDFDVDPSSLSEGDMVEYRIMATDGSSQSNQALLPTSGFFSFEIIDVLGLILIIDDDPATGKTTYTSEKGVTIRDLEKNAFGASSRLMRNTLSVRGFLVTEELASTTDPSTWTGYDLVIFSSGLNEGSLSNGTYRQGIIDYARAGHKYLIEGGEIGWTWRNDPAIMADVLHTSTWNADNAGPLNLISSQSTHPIVTTPNQLPSTIGITYTAFGSQEAMDVTDSYVLFEPNSEPNNAGIAVYDDNTDPRSAQSVYYGLNFAQITDSLVAKDLLQNTVNYLLTEETVVGIGDDEGGIPSAFALQQNYPNPFNPSTTISYELSEASQVTLRVFNLLGQEVRTLVDARQAAGARSVQWDGRDSNGKSVASGIYLYQLEAGPFRGVRKMILMK